MTAIHDLADRYVEQLATPDTVTATRAGIAGRGAGA